MKKTNKDVVNQEIGNNVTVDNTDIFKLSEKIKPSPNEVIVESSKENNQSPVKNIFKVGEKLKYGIYSSGIKVGNFIITYMGEANVDGKSVNFVTVEANAPGFYDFEEIYGDFENFIPIKVVRKIRLFGEDVFITEEYNQNNNEVLITRKAKEITVNKIKSEERVSNVILLLYHFRNQKNKYKIGDKIKFNLPTKKLEMLINKETEIKVPKGRFKAFFVKSVPSHFKVWITSDGEHIPLRINGAISFGNASLSLIEIE